MKRIALITLAAGLLLPACGDTGKPGTTPQATFESVREAVADHEWGVVYDLLEGREIERVKRQLETDRTLLEEQRQELLEELSISAGQLETMSARDYFIRYTEVRSRARPETIERIAKAEILETKVDGEKAVITWQAGTETKEMELALREGLWFVTRW
jgi:hypothetical protein